MIILRTPKGWTGPKFIEGKKIEGSFRSHQVPIVVDKEHNHNRQDKKACQYSCPDCNIILCKQRNSLFLQNTSRNNISRQ